LDKKIEERIGKMIEELGHLITGAYESSRARSLAMTKLHECELCLRRCELADRAVISDAAATTATSSS
jgi:uncharacterized Fe-S radical SAM superfamily protein PflX